MNDLNTAALQARDNSSLRNNFIQDNEELILRLAYKATGTYVTTSDDNYSIALIAFNEAIDSYDESKGNFTSFAALVIKRRLTDEYRKNKGEMPVSPSSFEAYGDEDETHSFDNSVTAKMNELAGDKQAEVERLEAMKAEIAEATQVLSYYGFTFAELAEYSPKSTATKATCRDAIICLLRPGDLYDAMRASKLLPIKEIETRTGAKRKTLERHRKYIMAVSELLQGDFPHLCEYLTDIKKGLESE